MPPLSENLLLDARAGYDCGPFGEVIHYFPEAASTNDIAREIAERDALEGTVVITDYQTAGRGRKGRSWEVEPETALLMTTLFRPAIHPAQVNRLVMACGLAIADACEEIADIQVDVKWPNDLQIEGKKFVGILPESALIDDHVNWVIVGTGINVNNIFAGDDPLSATAASLRQVTGTFHDRADLFARIMAGIYHWNALLDDPRLLDFWRARCITLGQAIMVTVGEKVYQGVAESLDDNGALQLQDNAGKLHTLTAGEATLRRSD